MLRVGKLTDYATWIIYHLASTRKAPQSAVEIARELPLPIPTVSKILKKLAHAGLLKSTRGVGGGYTLIANLNETSLVRLIDVMEGNFALTECTLYPGLCERESICQLRQNWQVINDRMRTALGSISVAELLQESVRGGAP